MSNPRIKLDESWDDPANHLDDFMATDVATIHFEANDQSQWYMTVELNDGQVWQLHFGAKNPQAFGYAFVEQIDARQVVLDTTRSSCHRVRMPQVVLLTTSEVAERFRVDTSVVRRWVAKGKLKPTITTPGGHYRFSEEYIGSFSTEASA